MSAKPASPVIRFIQQIAASPVVDEWTDEQLLAHFTAHRDEASFAGLVRRHGPLVLSVCRRLLRHEHDAEDVFQATFLVLVRKAASIRKGESVRSWLYGVASRIALKARQTGARRQARERAQVPRACTDPLEESTRRELATVLDQEVQRLPEKYRMPLVLCCLLGKTTAEAAVLLGWPRGTVGIRVSRGREMLRSRLLRRGLIGSAGFLVAAKSHAASWVVPEALMTRTVAAAASGTAHSYAATVSPHVLSLVKGAMQAMLLTRLKFALAIAVAVGGAGTGLVSFHALNAGSPPSRQKPAQASALRATDDAKDDSRGGEEEPNRNAAGDRRRSQNNLKQIGLAFHAYHDVHNHFPACAIYDKNGKALLGWRVALLPYLAEEELYKEFKLDEPWDSTHNKKLLEKMPAVFKAPGIKTKEPHTTYYQVVVGKGAIFDGEVQVTIANITDGLSNTMLAAEAEKPVPWTKPQDLAYDPEKALPKFGGVFSDGFNVLLADGAVLFVRKNTAEKNIRAAITRAGGEKERIGD